jgi:hypothetical protein
MSLQTPGKLSDILNAHEVNAVQDTFAQRNSEGKSSIRLLVSCKCRFHDVTTMIGFKSPMVVFQHDSVGALPGHYVRTKC